MHSYNTGVPIGCAGAPLACAGSLKCLDAVIFTFCCALNFLEDFMNVFSKLPPRWKVKRWWVSFKESLIETLWIVGAALIFAALWYYAIFVYKK